MAGRFWRRSAAVLTIAVAGFSNPTPALAAAGTWGAGRYAYADGVVCRNGQQTSPLAAWSVAGGHRAYLTRSVSSDGRVDSAVPPVPAAGKAQPTVTVSPGAEFPSDSDIAAVAYLLDHGGDAAALAAAVLTETDAGAVPPCGPAGAASTALDEARRLAGPYQVTVSAPSGQVHPGTAGAVSATVRNANGDPVAGAQVTFRGTDMALNPARAVTDASGTARTQAIVRHGAPAAVVLTASTSVTTGLLEATVTATPSVTNPTGASVPAVYPAPATSFSGQASVAVDQTAHPVVSTALDSRLVAANAGFVPRAQVTGLNGHTADVTFDLLGPKPLTDRTLCAGIADAAWKAGDVHVAATSTGTANGDATVQGGALSPNQPGCFALRTTVATIDASPQVVRRARLVSVAVLETTVTRDDEQPAITGASAPGQFTGRLRVGETHGLGGTVKVSLVGPIRPADGNCADDARGWTKAPRTDVAARVQSVDSSAAKVVAAGSYDYSFPAPTGVGCYRAQPALTLSGPDGDRLTVAPQDARPAYVLDPSVSATVRQTWSVTPNAVPVAVEVDRLYGLAAHVHIAMYRAAANPDGCARASFTGAARAGDGPDADVPPTPGVLTVAAESGPTPKQGCYAAVPELTVDANPRVRITGTLNDPAATLIAGVDPNQRPHTTAQHGTAGTPLGFVIAMSVLGGLLALAVARVGFVAWRDRDEGSGWSAPRDVDRLGLTEDELPSPV